ncbi:MAG: dihydroorotate dehydrogenase [Oscillospiraceae bacterium]|nr:dihydroorotate dehydrogenase [Oscillospiraceae bacterium]
MVIDEVDTCFFYDDGPSLREELKYWRKDLGVTLAGIPLDNPVIPASGTFGYGAEFAELYDIDCLGTFSFKGTTLEPRFGNPTPRIAEAPQGMLNAVGLQNPGVKKVISEELPRMKEFFHKPVMANVSGFSIDEYAQTCALLDKEEQVGWLEVNISCPNVHGGGMAFGSSPEAAAEVTRAVKAVTKKPVFMKLSPNVTDIAAIARACEDAGADGVSLINTLLAMRIDLKTKKPVLANGTGGLSGPAVFPVAVRMVYQVYEAVGIPIIGMGGVSSPEDVIEMMLAGATAVEVGAANLVDPFVCRNIIRKLPEVMEQYGIDSLTDIIGGAHHG